MQQTTLPLTIDALPTPAGAESVPDAQVAHLSSAFTELGEEHRVVLSLIFFERLGLADVALVLDDSEANVREVYMEGVALLSMHMAGRHDAAA